VARLDPLPWGGRRSATGEWDASAAALPAAKPDEFPEPSLRAAGVEKSAALAPDAQEPAVPVRRFGLSELLELCTPDAVPSAERSSGVAAPADASQLAMTSLRCSEVVPELRASLLPVPRLTPRSHLAAALLGEPPEQAKMPRAQESALPAEL